MLLWSQRPRSAEPTLSNRGRNQSLNIHLPMSTEDNDFDVAKKVADLIKAVGKERQQKILRWVAENFEVAIAAAPVAPALNPPATPVSQGPGQITPPPRATNIKSFVDLKSPRSDNQFATVVAYYYAFEAPPDERRDTITAEMLREATRLAQRKRLGTPSVTLGHAKSRGYLDAADRGQYRINSVGENLVAMALPSSGAVAEAKRNTAARRRSGKNKASSPKRAAAKKKRP